MLFFSKTLASKISFLPLLLRWLSLLAILIVELVGLSVWFESPEATYDTRWSAWVFENMYQFTLMGAVFAVSFLLTLIPRLPSILTTLREHSNHYRWWWIGLSGHLVIFTAFVWLTAAIFTKPVDPAHLSAAWLAGWVLFGMLTLLQWLLAVAPVHFWLPLARREYPGLLLGLLAGALVWVAVPFTQQELWSPLGEMTLRLVYVLLSFLYPDLLYQPEKFIIGTHAFRVQIGYQCSGFEGILLVTGFLALYLWVSRKALRFPQALWLFPLGIAVIAVANVVRIAALVVIGVSFSPEIAAGGFHSNAGWVTFIVIALGLVALSHWLQFFAITPTGAVVAQNHSRLATALVAPLLALLAVSMLTAMFSSGFESLYPLSVTVAAATLWHYRAAYRGLGWTASWQAVAIGVGVFLLWVLLEPDADSTPTALARGLADLSAGAAALWLVFRVLGSVVVVPLAEELAFRGYLLRKLVARNFEQVPLGQFTWLSFLGSSLLFGFLHERWLAGLLAGMAYAGALYRRARIGDAVVAHVTTNGLIASWVLTQQRWALWS